MSTINSLAHFKLSGLEAFLKGYPHITYATPSFPDYSSLRKVFDLDNQGKLLIIVRPQTGEDVSVLVKYAKSEGIEFVVRTGGHSVFGVSLVDGAMTIDMRDISYVEADQGKTSAKIGGGTLLGALARRLYEEDVVTPTGLFPTIGYAGWAMYSGYGPLSPKHGFGVDQIVGAKVVNADGDIVDADEKLLRGIRGAGGIFGVVTEITVKVYPRTKLFAGNMIFDSMNIAPYESTVWRLSPRTYTISWGEPPHGAFVGATTFEKFSKKYAELAAQDLPPELSLQRMVANGPHGPAIVIAFIWNSDDLDLGRQWLSKCKELGTVVMDTVIETSWPDLIQASNALVLKAVYRYSRMHSMWYIIEEVVKVLVECLGSLPSDPGTMFSIHKLRGSSADPKENSVLGTRTRIPLERIFGQHASDVVALKKEYDPTNTFDLAIPRLAHYVHG